MHPNHVLLTSALNQFQVARSYTLALVEDLAPVHWFWMPEPAISHIAWQVGHLAVAQYGLMLFRQRGRLDGDADLLPSDVRKLFMKGSTPLPDLSSYPRPEEILGLMKRIQEQVAQEAPAFEPQALDEPTDPPHAGPPTRMGSLLFAAHHEMLHAGQIGLLRRLIGLPSIR